MSSATEETLPSLNKLHKIPIYCKLGKGTEKLHSAKGTE